MVRSSAEDNIMNISYLVQFSKTFAKIFIFLNSSSCYLNTIYQKQY
jgi:hypothetical protein